MGAAHRRPRHRRAGKARPHLPTRAEGFRPAASGRARRDHAGPHGRRERPEGNRVRRVPGVPADDGSRRGQDRHRAGAGQGSDVGVRGDHVPGRAAVRRGVVRRGGGLRRRRVRADRAAGPRRCVRRPAPTAAAGAGEPAGEQRGQLTMATITRAPRRSSAVLTDRKARMLATPFRHVDLVLLGSVLAVSVLGVLMIYSSTQPRLAEAHLDQLYYVKRQAASIAVGLVLMVGVMAIDYRKLRDTSVLLYGATVLARLALLAGLGAAARGAQAGFPIAAGFVVQPSEFAKFALIVAWAGALHQHRGDLAAWRVAVTVVLAVVPIGLILLHPD